MVSTGVGGIDCQYMLMVPRCQWEFLGICGFLCNDIYPPGGGRSTVCGYRFFTTNSTSLSSRVFSVVTLNIQSLPCTLVALVVG